MAQTSTQNGQLLPDNWAWTTLGEFADTSRMRTEPQEHPDLPYIGMDNIESETMRLLGTRKASEMVSSAEYFQPDDVLYGRLRPYLNKVYRPDFEGLCSSEFIIFRKNPYIASKYVQYFLNQWSFVAFINRQNTGDRPRVKFEQMADYPFPLAPLTEQQHIVAEIEKQFTRLDAAVSALKRLQANLTRYKTAVLKAACEGRLVAQDPNDEPAEKLLERILAERRRQWEEAEVAKMVAAGRPPKDDKWKARYQEPERPDTSELPELPAGWVWAALGQCFITERGRFSVRPRNDPRYYGGEYPFVQIGDLPRDGGNIKGYSQTLNENGLAVSKKFHSGTVLIAIVGATIGNTGILTFDSCCPDSLVAFQSDDEIRLRFGELYLRSKKLEIRAASYASGGQPNINLAYLLPYVIALPPLLEQKRIIEEVERCLSVVEALEKSVADDLARAGRLRQAILQKAFSGRLVPQDPNDESAAVLLERIRGRREQGS